MRLSYLVCSSCSLGLDLGGPRCGPTGQHLKMWDLKTCSCDMDFGIASAWLNLSV